MEKLNPSALFSNNSATSRLRDKILAYTITVLDPWR